MRDFSAKDESRAKWFLEFLTGILKGRMVDALARKSDEGRGVAAIRFGEVPSNL